LAIGAALTAQPNPDRTAGDWFREEAAVRGLRFRHFHGGTGRYYLPESLGSGVSLIDYDNDGDLDIYLPQGASLDPARPGFPAGASPSSRLFRNLLAESGTLRFSDVTAAAGVQAPGYSMGAAVGDYDNDGLPDLFVTGVNRVILYRNLGGGRFADRTAEAGLSQDNENRITTGAAFFDYDRDNDLDLLVLSYVDFTIAGNKKCPGAQGRLDYCKPSVYHPLPARLFRNEGSGRFRDVSEASGIGGAAGAGLGLAIADFDSDGWLDVYVANDGTPNHLWMNRKGRFEETALPAGVAYDDQGRAQAGMGVAAVDLDGDGDEDIAVTNLMGEGMAAYENDGRAEFAWASAHYRLTPNTLPFTGFGLAAADFDLDGALDLFLANGSVSILEDQPNSPYPYGQRNQLFRGPSFEPVRLKSIESVEASRGAAYGDLDRDGDLDLVISNSNGPARLLLNQAAERGASSLAVETPGYGEMVGLKRRGKPTEWRRSSRAGSYLSSNDPAVYFALSPGQIPEQVSVRWIGGAETIITDIPAKRLVVARPPR
jgi:hypothetical protein